MYTNALSSNESTPTGTNWLICIYIQAIRKDIKDEKNKELHKCKSNAKAMQMESLLLTRLQQASFKHIDQEDETTAFMDKIELDLVF